MKRNYYLSLALTGMFLFSCSNEDVDQLPADQKNNILLTDADVCFSSFYSS